MKSLVVLFVFFAYLSGCAKIGAARNENRFDSERSRDDYADVTKPFPSENLSSQPLDTDQSFEQTDTETDPSPSSQKANNNQFRQERIHTGRYRSTTKEEILARIAPRLSRSTADLPVTYGANGEVLIDLKGRFSHVSLAKRMPDGTIRHTCVDNIKSAEAWLSSSERLPKE